MIQVMKRIFRNIFFMWSFVSVFVVLVIIVIVLVVTKNPEIESEAVVSVNGETVSQSDVDQELTRLKQFYASQNQKIQQSETLEADTIEKLIEKKLLTQYANDQNITVSDDEIEKRYRDVLKLKSEKELLDELENMYGIGKEEYFEVLYLDILREKVQEKADKPYAEWVKEKKQKSIIEF